MKIFRKGFFITLMLWLISFSAWSALVEFPVTISEGPTQTEVDWTAIGNGSDLVSAPDFSIDDANLNDPYKGDAYDDFFVLSVNGEAYTQVDNAGDPDDVDQEEVLVDSTVIGTKLTSQTNVMSDLNVTQEYLFLRDVPAVRVMVCLENPTMDTIEASVNLNGDFGSDNETTINGSSSGDTAISSIDNWVITADTDTDPPGDPAINNVFNGPGNPQVKGQALVANTVEEYISSYDLSIPGESTRCVMVFSHLYQTIADAIDDSTRYDSNEALLATGAVSDLTDEELNQIVNWDCLGGCFEIGDTVWNDKNGDGLQDDGEEGIGGISVQLLDSTGTTVLDQTSTDGTGLYSFANVLPGTYIVEVGFPESLGASFSPQDEGDDDSLDSDVDTETGRTDPFVLDGDNDTIDIGLVIENLVDSDGDGFPDVIETAAGTNPNDATSKPSSGGGCSLNSVATTQSSLAWMMMLVTLGILIFKQKKLKV